MELGRPDKLDELLINHEDGKTYLNSKAAKETLVESKKVTPKNNIFTMPDNLGSVSKQVKGPSYNVSVTCNGDETRWVLPSKDTRFAGIAALNECLGFIRAIYKYLERFYSHIFSEFTKLEKAIETKKEIFNITDIKELAYVVLPTNRERKNILLQAFLSLLAFINELLSIIHYISRIKENLHEKLGIVKYTFLPLLSYPTELIEDLASYINYLFHKLPKEVLQKYKDNAAQGLLHFVQECLCRQPSAIKKLLKALQRCKEVLIPRYHLLHSIYNDMEDKLKNPACEMHVEFDFVPSILVEDWPHIAGEWLTRCRTWPEMSIVKDIVLGGCHIVPKPYTGQERNDILDWRWSFSRAEKILAKLRTKNMSLSYFLMKSIFYKYLKGVEHNGDTLTSYLIKTVMLWQCEDKSESWWSKQKITSCVSTLLNRLKISFSSRYLPHYFIRDINLLDNVADELIQYGQAVLESICADPTICILEILEKIHNEEIPKFSLSSSNSDTEDGYHISCCYGAVFSIKGVDLIFEIHDEPGKTPNIPLMIAEFREAIKIREEKYKHDPSGQKIAEILKRFCEEKMPLVFPGAYKKSFSISREEISQNCQLPLGFVARDIEQELECTDVFQIGFKGSGVNNFLGFYRA